MKFPITKDNGKSYTIEELFELLAKESTGHYLLGNHNFWHGGIHFTDASVPQCTQKEPIRCIADGEVIAYRINDNYPFTIYANQTDGKVCKPDDLLELLYSSSFCLVKHKYQSAKRLDEASDKVANAWQEHTFILQQSCVIRDVATTDDRACTFKGILPKGTCIRVLDFSEKIQGNNSFANISILSLPNKQTIVKNTKPNATKEEIALTMTIEDQAYIVAFDRFKAIATNNSGALLKEYIIQEDLLGKTLRLNTGIKASTTRIHPDLLDAKQVALNEHQPQIKPPLEYQALLPKGIQILVIAYDGINAVVEITRPVKAKLINNTSVAKEYREIQLEAGDRVTITLLQSDKKQLETYAITPTKQAPIAEIATPTSDYQGQTIILEQQATATIDKEFIDNPTTFQLPIATKLQLQSTEPPTQDRTNYTEVKLLHATTVISAEDKAYYLAEGTIVYVNLFDYYGNLTTALTQTDNPYPLYNELTYYSLYMHLLPSEEYIKSQIIPFYIKGTITATVKANGLDAYSDDTTKTLVGTIAMDGLIQYNPDITTQHTYTDAKTKKTTEIILTYCQFRTGNFKKIGTLKKDQHFWAVINNNVVTPIKITPDNPNTVNNCTIPIKAGDPIGYMGLYQTPQPQQKPLILKPENTETTTIDSIFDNVINIRQPKLPILQTNSKSQLHLEVFTPQTKQLETFIQNKAKLETGRTYLQISKGATVVQHKQSKPLKKGEKPIKETTYLVTQQHHLELNNLKSYSDKDQWYEISIIENNQTIKGHIKQSDPNIKTINQNNWQQLGFTIVEEHNETASGYVNPNNTNEFFQKLYKQLDTNNDGNLDSTELKRTLTDPQIRDQWTKLIGNHPSEWCYRESKWSILDKLLQHNPELLRHEKERIKTLSFWNEVPELANTPKVCHLHPVAFYQYALRRCGNPTCICHEAPKLNNDYFVLHPKIKNAKINTCNNSGLFKTGVKLIVLHRTSGGAAQGTLNHMATQGYGAHFVIDNQHGEDGIINQTISLNKRGSHMGAAQFKETKANGWGNHNAIGIEVCGYSLDAQGNKVVKNTDPPHDHWEPVTEKQAQSIACLVKFLLSYFNLSLNDVKCHEDLCVKTENEGKEVYKAMMKYW